MAADKDRRVASRTRLECPLRYRVIPVQKADFRSALVEDVSQTGFRFHSQEYLPKRASLLVEMQLPGARPVRSLARAVWVRERSGDDGFEVGGVFVEPPYEARTALKHIVPGQ